MTNATWCFVDLQTGEFTGAVLRGGLQIGMHERPGLLAVIGDYSPKTHRYDLAEGRVVERAEPLPEPVDPGFAVIEAHGALRALDASSVRALRELVLALVQGQEVPTAALDRLLQIEGQAPARRAEMGNPSP